MSIVVGEKMWTTSRLLFLSPPWPPPLPPFINIATSVLSTAVSSIAQACQVFRRAKHFRRVDQFLTCSGNTYTTQSPGRPLADDDSATWATGSSSWGSNVLSCRTCAKHFQKSFGQIYRRMGEITGSFWVGATEEASNTGYCRLTCTLHRYPHELFFFYLCGWLWGQRRCVCVWMRESERDVRTRMSCQPSPKLSSKVLHQGLTCLLTCSFGSGEFSPSWCRWLENLPNKPNRQTSQLFPDRLFS